MNKKDIPNLVEWELTISGYNELSQSDKDLARGIIAEAIEVFNNFEGSFSITKDEDDLVCHPTAEGSYQEAGVCPVCGSTDLDYDSLSIDNLQGCYPWVCNTCKSSGEEWHDLHFIEHTNIEKDEDGGDI